MLLDLGGTESKHQSVAIKLQLWSQGVCRALKGFKRKSSFFVTSDTQTSQSSYRFVYPTANLRTSWIQAAYLPWHDLSRKYIHSNIWIQWSRIKIIDLSFFPNPLPATDFAFHNWKPRLHAMLLGLQEASRGGEPRWQNQQVKSCCSHSDVISTLYQKKFMPPPAFFPEPLSWPDSPPLPHPLLVSSRMWARDKQQHRNVSLHWGV